MRKAFEQKIPHHQYSIGVIHLLMQLVFDGANHLRTSAGNLKIIGTAGYQDRCQLVQRAFVGDALGLLRTDPYQRTRG